MAKKGQEFKNQHENSNAFEQFLFTFMTNKSFPCLQVCWFTFSQKYQSTMYVFFYVKTLLFTDVIEVIFNKKWIGRLQILKSLVYHSLLSGIK